MILLDTNILSEPYRQHADSAVRRWLNRQQRHDLFLCAPVLAELHYGVERLAKGARRDGLAEWIQQIEDEFSGRFLPFDRSAAKVFARVVVARNRLGRPIGPIDAQIAAIALSQGAIVATRDVDGFAGIELDIVNPFDLR